MNAFTKYTWKNRVSENPSRRKLTPVSGLQNVYDVTREEGVISQQGSAFSADNMNSLEDRVYNAFESLVPVVLYSNEQGTVNTITLNDTSANYKIIDIFYGVGNNLYSSSRIYEPNGKSLDLCDFLSENINYNHSFYVRSGICTINDNILSYNANRTLDFSYKKDFGITYFEDVNILFIRKVIGYR